MDKRRKTTVKMPRVVLPTPPIRMKGSNPPPPPKKDSYRPRTTPTIGTLNLGNIRLHESLIRVFNTYGYGPFELDAVVYFALQGLEVTPITYNDVSRRIRDYIIAHFEITQGSLLPQGQVSIRKVMITYKK